jgi:hypothetical protein
MAILLMPLPDSDFDPTESGVPWRTMRDSTVPIIKSAGVLHFGSELRDDRCHKATLKLQRGNSLHES